MAPSTAALVGWSPGFMVLTRGLEFVCSTPGCCETYLILGYQILPMRENFLVRHSPAPSHKFVSGFPCYIPLLSPLTFIGRIEANSSSSIFTP